MVSPFNSVKVCRIIALVIRHLSMDNLFPCKSVKYVVFYRKQIHNGVRLSCLVKKSRLEPTPRLLNYRPDICCAKNKVLFETKTFDTICVTQYFPAFTLSHSAVYTYRSELFCKLFITVCEGTNYVFPIFCLHINYSLYTNFLDRNSVHFSHCS